MRIGSSVEPRIKFENKYSAFREQEKIMKIRVILHNRKTADQMKTGFSLNNRAKRAENKLNMFSIRCKAYKTQANSAWNCKNTTGSKQNRELKSHKENEFLYNIKKTVLYFSIFDTLESLWP